MGYLWPAVGDPLPSSKNHPTLSVFRSASVHADDDTGFVAHSQYPHPGVSPLAHSAVLRL